MGFEGKYRLMRRAEIPRGKRPKETTPTDTIFKYSGRTTVTGKDCGEIEYTIDAGSFKPRMLIGLPSTVRRLSLPPLARGRVVVVPEENHAAETSGYVPYRIGTAARHGAFPLSGVVAELLGGVYVKPDIFIAHHLLGYKRYDDGITRVNFLGHSPERLHEEDFMHYCFEVFRSAYGLNENTSLELIPDSRQPNPTFDL